MNDDIILLLNKIKKTQVSDFTLCYKDKHFGSGNIKVCNIQMNKIIYQFIICNTCNYSNKLLVRYYDKIWSNVFVEENYINDSKYYFDIDESIINNKKQYRLLKNNYIYSIIMTKNNQLLINKKNTMKGK